MTRTRWMTIAAGMTAGLLAATAAAGPEHEKHEHAEHEHASTFEFVSIDDDDKFEIIVRDGETTARVNGVLIADELVKTAGDKVVILSDDGSVLKELAIAAPRAPRVPGAPLALRARTAPQVWRFGLPDSASELERAIEIERPPVMLGVLLDGPSEALQAQLGVSEHAIVIEKVMDGLPADKAGLRQWDIIVEIDGDEVDGGSFLRDILMESEPGDELDLLVIRKGEELELELELAAYDSDELGTPSVATITTEVNPGQDGRFPFTLDNQWTQRGGEETKRAIEEAMREIEKLGVFGNDQETTKKFRQQLERMQRSLGAQAETLRRSRGLLLNEGRLIYDDDEREAMAEGLEDRLEDLEDQLEDRLEAIEDRMEERWERMERVFDRMLDRFEDMLENSRDDRD
jgi:hypothetical protein